MSFTNAKKGICLCAVAACLLMLVLPLSPSALAAGGSAVNTAKACNLSIVYGFIALLSLILVLGYSILDKDREIKFVLLFICVFLANCGYFLLSVAADLRWALIANRISYFGAAYSVLLMLLIIMDVCCVEYGKQVLTLLVAVSTAVFLIAASGGITDHYYTNVAIEKINGTTTLVKVYGPLHTVYPVYLFLYFALMVWIAISFALHKKNTAPQYAFFLAAIVLGNIGVWLVEQLVHTNFEFLSVSYIATELLLLLLYSMLRSYGILTKNGQMCMVRQSACRAGDSSGELPPNMEELFDTFAHNVQKLSAAEMRVLSYYIDGHEIAEVPALAYISINTVKKHNRNIYQKLGVSSRDDLMLYIELFRRCGRLEELLPKN